MKSTKLSLSLASLVACTTAHGAGFFIPNQSAEATARGNAFVATANDPSAVYYNPAGLSLLTGPEVQAGVYAITLGNTFTNGAGSFEADDAFQAVPHLYFGVPLSDKVSIGTGVNVPFGLSTDWGTGASNPFPFVATKSEFQYLSAYLVGSYQINDCLSIGGGFTVNRADAELSRYDLATSGNLTLEGDAVALGGMIGVLYQPSPMHSLGAVFRTGSEFTLEGKATLSGLGFTSFAEVDFDIPDTAAIGYAFRPNERLTIEANIEWINWDSLNTYEVLVAGMPSGNFLAFDWESTFVYEIGATYQVTDALSVHAGYDFNEGAQPDKFYNPAVADADRHWINLGATYRSESFDWTLGYQFGWSDHTVTDSIIGTNGDYEARHHAIYSSLSYRF